MHFVSNKHKPRGCMHTHHAAGLACVFDIRNRVYFIQPVNLSSYRGGCGLKVRLGSSSRVFGAQVIVGSAAMLVARAFGVVCFSLLSNIKSLPLHTSTPPHTRLKLALSARNLAVRAAGERSDYIWTASLLPHGRRKRIVVMADRIIREHDVFYLGQRVC